jgi:hypothetical protein
VRAFRWMWIPALVYAGFVAALEDPSSPLNQGHVSPRPALPTYALALNEVAVWILAASALVGIAVGLRRLGRAAGRRDVTVEEPRPRHR